MTRLIRFDELKDIKSEDKMLGIALEYQHREALKGNKTESINWDEFDRWCQKYYNGYLSEKYIYDHCPEIRPIDPDWEYLCHMEHFGSHTYDCTYKDISADIKYCWKNKTSTDFLYVKANNKPVSKLFHGAELIIGINMLGDICYGTTDDYSEVQDNGEVYYKFPIKGIIKHWYSA